MTTVTAKSVFLDAVDLPSVGERERLLDSQCHDNPDLRREVEQLLRHHGELDRFLESPPTLVASLADTAHESPHEAPTLGFLSPPDRPDSLGRLGHYVILELIGYGGFGVVLKALDEKLRRIVAIKTLAEPLAASPTARKRFVREARAAAAVRHDHVVDIHAVEDEGPVPFLVMEYVAGESLEDRLRKHGPLSPSEIVRIGRQVAEGLMAAHAQGLAHRDIKPANILLEGDVARVKITDFGLALAVDDASLTTRALVVGTPAYMSAEQARGEPLDHRTDLFSLGSVLYALCTGRHPFDAQGTMAVLRQIADDSPRPIREINPLIPEWLVEIIAKLHAKNPADRFQSAAEVAELLGQHVTHLEQPQRTPMPVPRSLGRNGAQRGFAGGRWRFAAAVVGLLVGGLALTEATGISRLAATIIQILTPKGTLVVQVDDPKVNVTIEGDGGIVITGAGAQEVRLRPGDYRVEASKDGRPVHRELVNIRRGDMQVVKVTLTPAAAAADAANARVLRAHTGPVWSVAFTRDGSKVLSASADSSVRVWDVASRKELQRFEGHKFCVYALAISPDGKRALSGSGGRPGVVDERTPWSVCLWEIDSGKELHRSGGNGDAITSLAFSRDGRQALIASYDGAVRLWDVEHWKEIKHFSQPRGLWSVCFSPDDRQALTAGGYEHQPHLRLWDLVTGETRRDFIGHEHGCWSATIVPGGSRVLSTSGDKTIRLWDVDSDNDVHRFRVANSATCAAVSADGRFALVGTFGLQQTVKLWNLETKAEVAVFEGHTGGVQTVAMSADGRRAASGSHDHTVRLWDLPAEVHQAATKKN